MPVEIIRLDADDPIKGLLLKAWMFELSPFRETLYLDADTVALGRLDFAFLKAKEFGLACCIYECPWARRHNGVHGETIEYNTGVLFFGERAKAIFESWSRLAPQIDSSIIFHGPQGQMMKFSPFVLPLNWNFRPNLAALVFWSSEGLARLC
jgi:hypothetical protein